METPSPCPVDAVLKLLAGPWTTHVLWALQTHGTLRFGALKRAIPGVSSRLLAERLRRLTAAGFVLRHCVATVPPQVSYSLTVRGRKLGEVLAQLQPIVREWTEQGALGAARFDEASAAERAVDPKPDAHGHGELG